MSFGDILITSASNVNKNRRITYMGLSISILKQDGSHPASWLATDGPVCWEGL